MNTEVMSDESESQRKSGFLLGIITQNKSRQNFTSLDNYSMNRNGYKLMDP